MDAGLHKQIDWYRRSLQLRGDVVVDVGANVGHISAFFFEHADETSRVVSVEPLSVNLRALRARVEAARSPRWTVRDCALSDRDGTGFMRSAFSLEHGFDAVLVEERGPHGAHEQVAVQRLSTLVPDATVIKLDIEGGEYRVLDEALPALKRARAWAIEFHMSPQRPLQSALRQLADHGYSLQAAAQRPDDPSGRWHGVSIEPTLTWEGIPRAGNHADGSIFKMLHVLASRET